MCLFNKNKFCDIKLGTLILYIIYYKANKKAKRRRKAKIKRRKQMNKLMNKVRKNKKGFTLIELIVVIAILGILVLLAAPRFLGYTKDAKVATMQADSKVLANAALVYNIENEDWPVAGEEVTYSVKTPEGFPKVNGSVIAKAFDEDVLKNHVQTLKGDFEDYALVIKSTVDGLDEGDVILVKDTNDEVQDEVLEGIADRDGDRHFSSGFSVDNPDNE